MISRFAIVTLIFFFLPTIFAVRPFSFDVSHPRHGGKHKVTIDLIIAQIVAIAILWASQCLGARQIRNGIVGTDDIEPYNIVITFISLAYMIITLDFTGVLPAAAFWVSNKGGSRGRRLYLYFYLLLTLISVFIGNYPTVIISGTTFLIYYIKRTGLDTEAWVFSEFAAANTASMVLFVGNPANLVICEGFRINSTAFTAYMILPFVACSIVCYLTLMLQFRNEGHVPRELGVSTHLNPEVVLVDKVGAIFGTIWLAASLIVAFVLNVYHVDVWKVALPFAGGKFIFDISWDHYRYSTGNKRQCVYDSLAKALHGIVAQRTPPENRQDRNGVAAQPDGSAFEALNSTYQRPPAPNTSNFTPSPVSMPTRRAKLAAHFPTFFTAFPRLPFILIPFTFSQFILVEALEHQGWIDIFARWLVITSNKQIIPVVWLVGVFGVILCNISGTNIGATILLTKIVRAADFPEGTARAAAVSLAVASNIGAVSFTFSASLGGMMWVAILKEKNFDFKQRRFVMRSILPLVGMMGVGLGVVSAMMTILY